MIISDWIVISLLSFTTMNAPVNPSYDYGAKFSAQKQLTTLSLQGNAGSIYTLETQFQISGTISYEDGDVIAYQCTDVKFSLYCNVYYISAAGQRELEDSFSVVYSPTLTFTQNTSTPFADYSFVYGSAYEDDEVFARIKYQDTVVAEHYLEVDATLSGYNSNATYVIDNSYFKNAIANWIMSTGLAYNDGYDAGKAAGETAGYSKGYADGIGGAMNPEMFTIFNGILNVAMVPVNVFLGIFNFEVFGINIASLVSSFLSIAILVIVIRLIMGGKSKGD